MSPNAPRRRGAEGAFEIWFLAVFDPDAGRALWLRLTTLSPSRGGEARAIVWAAAFEAGGAPLALKAISALADLSYGDGFDMRVGDVELRDGATRGAVRSAGREIAWELRWDVGPRSTRRRLVDLLPLPVHAVHGVERARFDGWFSVDGVRRDLGGRARGVQQHIWGERQAQEILWIFAPHLDADDGGHCEIASVRLRRGAPRVTMVHARAGDLEVGRSDVPRALGGRATVVGPGVLEIRAGSARRLVVARASAAVETFAGYVYRDPTGAEVHVAQSDLATCDIEVYRRRGVAWRPEVRASAALCALEIHRPEPLEGVSYLAWDDPGPVAPRVATGIELGASRMASPPKILALGLTYADHLRETGTVAPPEPVVFEKPGRTWLPVGDHVRVPASDEIEAELDALEPGLGAALRARFRFLPAMMDYEVELGFVLLDAVRADDLEGARPRLGFFLANDLTARVCQVLGEGAPDPYRFWALAKGFAGFLPVSDALWSPPTAGLDAWPDLRLRLFVRDELRQDGSTKDLCYTPRQMLRAASRALGGDLPEGLAIVTGTPAGVAMQVPAWKRRVADLVLDRFGKLGAAIDAYAKSDRFLRAGDVVTCDGGPLGRRTVRLVSR